MGRRVGTHRGKGRHRPFRRGRGRGLERGSGSSRHSGQCGQTVYHVVRDCPRRAHEGLSCGICESPAVRRQTADTQGPKNRLPYRSSAVVRFVPPSCLSVYEAPTTPHTRGASGLVPLFLGYRILLRFSWSFNVDGSVSISAGRTAQHLSCFLFSLTMGWYDTSPWGYVTEMLACSLE